MPLRRNAVAPSHHRKANDSLQEFNIYCCLLIINNNV